VALRFCRDAVDPSELSDEARLEQAIVHSRLRIRAGRVRRRRGPFVARVRLGGAGCTAWVIRVPLVGVRVVGQGGGSRRL